MEPSPGSPTSSSAATGGTTAGPTPATTSAEPERPRAAAREPALTPRHRSSRDARNRALTSRSCHPCRSAALARPRSGPQLRSVTMPTLSGWPLLAVTGQIPMAANSPAPQHHGIENPQHDLGQHPDLLGKTWKPCASIRTSTGKRSMRSSRASCRRCGTWPAARSTGPRSSAAESPSSATDTGPRCGPGGTTTPGSGRSISSASTAARPPRSSWRPSPSIRACATTARRWRSPPRPARRCGGPGRCACRALRSSSTPKPPTRRVRGRGRRPRRGHRRRTTGHAGQPRLPRPTRRPLGARHWRRPAGRLAAAGRGVAPPARGHRRPHGARVQRLHLSSRLSETKVSGISARSDAALSGGRRARLWNVGGPG